MYLFSSFSVLSHVERLALLSPIETWGESHVEDWHPPTSTSQIQQLHASRHEIWHAKKVLPLRTLSYTQFPENLLRKKHINYNSPAHMAPPAGATQFSFPRVKEQRWDDAEQAQWFTISILVQLLWSTGKEMLRQAKTWRETLGAFLMQGEWLLKGRTDERPFHGSAKTEQLQRYSAQEVGLHDWTALEHSVVWNLLSLPQKMCMPGLYKMSAQRTTDDLKK